MPILAGDEWDSSDVGRRPPGRGRRGHAGVHERAVARLLRDDEDPAPRRARLQAAATSKEDATVAIVNRRFAEHFFQGKSAVGKHIGFGAGPKTKLDIEIIGVVADSLYEGPREGVRRQVFVPNWGKNSAAFYVRTQTRVGERLQPRCATRCKQLDAAMPVYAMKTLEAQLDETLLTDRLIALLSAGFGLLATLLASIGLYGVMAFVVARRTKELGIRLALGAQPGVVIWLVMREVLLLLAIGLAVGIPAAHRRSASTSSSQLYGIQAHDPLDRRPRRCVLLDARVGRGRPDPGAPRQPDRSDPGAAHE